MAETLCMICSRRGRITEGEHQLIVGALNHDSESSARLRIPGNITLCSAALTELEAASKVFNTAELLEAILAKTNVRRLHRLKCTCRGFKRMVDESPLLGKMMYLKADKRCSFAWFPFKHGWDKWFPGQGDAIGTLRLDDIRSNKPPMLSWIRPKHSDVHPNVAPTTSLQGRSLRSFPLSSNRTTQ
jgi:hypothetical protein